MSTEVERIKEGLAPLFVEARTKGLWFWCRYQDLWFSPDQLEAEHASGKFVWGAVNWQLRDPMERLREAERRAASANAEVARIRTAIGV